MKRQINDDALYRWIKTCAECEKPAPTSAQIADRYSVTVCGAKAALRRLIGKGLITSDRLQYNKRRVTVCATGQQTAYPTDVPMFRQPPLHDDPTISAVLQWNKKGLTIPGIARKVGLTEPRVASILRHHLPPKPVPETPKPKPRPQLMAIGPSRTCMWIEAPDFLERQRKGEAIYCGKASVSGRSWCREHTERAIVPLKRGEVA